tara:strand:- start:21357 stop:21590 length:234 start_codon:yes stop_codon:yes gene_type:complete
MKSFTKLLDTKNGIMIFSILLGLGVAGLFKMSCDSRSCVVYKAPDFSEIKIVNVNGKCYEVTEDFIECDKNKEKIYL